MPTARYWLRVPGEEWREVTLEQYIDEAKTAGTLPYTHFVTASLEGVIVFHEGPPKLDDYIQR